MAQIVLAKLVQLNRGPRAVPMSRRSIAFSAVVLAALGGSYIAIRSPAVDSSKMPSVRETAHADKLVRPHSPVLGPPEAPVTIVEFFDPACEACRAFYPIVKDLLARHPKDVRLVLRYAPFHQDADKVVRLLEASKAQDLYWQVLDALLNTQPMWADHSRPPDLDLAFRAAEQAGLDLQRAHADAGSPEMNALLRQEMDDLIALKIEKTPTFFINGERLTSFSIEQFHEFVAEKVAQASKSP